MQRPLGITILGILYMLGGIGSAIAALMFGVFSVMMVDSMMMGEIAVFGGLISGVFVGVAVLEFVIAGCLLSGKSWARKIIIVFVVIDLVLEFFSIFGGNMVGVAMIILDLFVLYYLYRPYVIEYFGEMPYKSCSYCGYMAKDERELHNHLITCKKKEENE
jgi:hypothetical protein